MAQISEETLPRLNAPQHGSVVFGNREEIEEEGLAA